MFGVLTRLGIIKGYRALFNYKSLGLDFQALASVKVENNWTDSVAEALLNIPHVQEVHEVAGEYSYFVKIYVEIGNIILKLCVSK